MESVLKKQKKIVEINPIGRHVLELLETRACSLDYVLMCTFPANQTFAQKMFESYIELGVLRPNDTTDRRYGPEYVLSLYGWWIIFLEKKRGTYGKRIYVDFDGTICPKGHVENEPFPGCVETINLMMDMGI